jgi:hypothetical protein
VAIDPPEPAWLGVDADPALLATIWGTVDLERALRDLGVDVDGPGAPPTVEDPLLGARVTLVATALGRLAVAEPSTEGRLAATLARNDEGPAGRYVAVELASSELAIRAAAAGVRLGGPATGPFGRAVVVLGGRIGEPDLILVPRSAVPSRP